MKKITYLLILLLAFNFGFGQTTLVKEDIAIVGVNTDTDNFTFLLRTDITAGTTIYFTDNEVNTAGTGLNNAFEGVILFTAASDYTCGTVISYLSNSTEFTNISGSFLLANNSGEVVLAFQGYNTTTYEWTTFLHANIDPTITLPVGFTVADIVDGTQDNREYIGSTDNPTWTDLNNIANYHQSNDYSSITLNTSAFSCGPCLTTVTYNGTWSGTPDATTEVIIAADYNTALGDISACSLIINSDATLTVDNGDFVEVEHDVTVDGTLIVQTQGNFVQNDDTGTFTNNGTSRVNKTTASKADWFYYTYWSSPVKNETIGNVFPDVDGDRRFKFIAANFLDTDGDDIDDDDNAWQPAFASETMTPGVGYAVTESRFFFGGSGTASFEGEFNTREVPVSISNVPGNAIASWNFIGNPYPSAIDFDAFYTANATVVDGTAYFWSQATPPAESNPGNEQSNFSKNDYAMYAAGSGGGVAGPSGVTPNQYIPSGQGFFIAGLSSGTATFTNAMRMADNSSNNLFFKNSNSKSKTATIDDNRIWINLTSDNGVFNQILIAYVDGATSGNDGLAFDAPRLLTADFPATLYSAIENSNIKYAIQGKASNSINETEVVKLGFITNIEVATLYKLSIAQFEGDFLTSNNVYLKDNLLNKLHDLSASDYTFTSEIGEFNERFEILYNANALSTEDISNDSNALKIIELEDDRVQFTTSRTINTVRIFDLLGRQLYQFKGQSNSETYTLSNLSSTVYIAKVELTNGLTITKKAFKK